MDNVDLGRPRNTSVGDYNRKQTFTTLGSPLLILAVYRLPSGSPYQTPIAPPSPNMGATSLGYPPAPAAGYPPSNYPPSGHGPDIYRAPSPYRGAPEPAILSRSRAPSPNPMGGPGPGIYGQRAPSPNPGAMPQYGGNRSRAPSPIPGSYPPAQYPQPLNRSRAPSPLPGAPPPPYSGQPGFNALPRSPRHGGGAPLAPEPQMLSPPDGFSRPANLAQSYTFFDTMKIQDMDDFYENMPRMPKVLVPHDVYHEDWIRFIQVRVARSHSFYASWLTDGSVGPRASVGCQAANRRPEPLATFRRRRRASRALEQLLLRPTRRRSRTLQGPRATLRSLHRPNRPQPPRLRLGRRLERLALLKRLVRPLRR
jgi:hypothetical protein